MKPLPLIKKLFCNHFTVPADPLEKYKCGIHGFYLCEVQISYFCGELNMFNKNDMLKQTNYDMRCAKKLFINIVYYYYYYCCT